jgi:beta-galactosidase
MSKSNNVVIKILWGMLFFSINILYAQTLPDWKNPDSNGINKKKSYAYSFLYRGKG